MASTTIQGPYQLAVSGVGNTIGVAMALGNDRGLPGGYTLLDLALEGDTDALQKAGLSPKTADTLCQAAATLSAKAPGEPLADQPTLFFEAGSNEVAITPLVSVRVLQQINARLADAGGSVQRRLALPITQGGANPQNVAHYVNSSPRREGETLVNRNTRRGHYNALRAHCPNGARSRPERDLARVVATCSLASTCQVTRQAAQDYRSRAVMGLLLPGATIRLAKIRAAEHRDAGIITRNYLAPLLAMRSHLHSRGREQGYALNRLSGPARSWLEKRSTTRDVTVLAGEMAEDLIRKVELSARGALPPAARSALFDAMAKALGEIA